MKIMDQIINSDKVFWKTNFTRLLFGEESRGPGVLCKLSGKNIVDYFTSSQGEKADLIKTKCPNISTPVALPFLFLDSL